MARDFDKRVRDHLAERFAHSPRIAALYADLWMHHFDAGYVDAHFVSEITSGNHDKFRQRLWEMILGRHLTACGHSVSSRPDGEPDFRFTYNGVTVWVEAISPSAGPDLSMDPPTGDLKVPHEARLLRWTGAFAEKWAKGQKYREKGVVKAGDAYVIAIDGSWLGWFPLAHGASQSMPYVVEATLAAGRAAIRYDEVEGRILGFEVMPRLGVTNRNGSPVRMEPFFSEAFAGVSAAIGFVQCGDLDFPLSVQVAHNPLAHVGIAPKLFGNDAEEWSATIAESTDEWTDWDLHRV